MQGILALDIDGTLIHGMERIPSSVLHYLTNLHRHGWNIIFITGRTYTFAYDLLKDIRFPYLLSLQNGAATVEMPERNLIRKKYLSVDLIPLMEKIFSAEGTGPIVYGGLEVDDVCYYREDHLSPQILAYLKRRQGPFLEAWENLSCFDELPFKHFPSLKCFGSADLCLRIADKIKRLADVEVTVINDPFDSNYFLAQVTHPEANKGNALNEYVQLIGNHLPVIAAGDDNNDLSMLEIAKIKIVMKGAPDTLLKIADVVAPSSQVRGIIPGLKRAIGLL